MSTAANLLPSLKQPWFHTPSKTPPGACIYALAVGLAVAKLPLVAVAVGEGLNAAAVPMAIATASSVQRRRRQSPRGCRRSRLPIGRQPFPPDRSLAMTDADPAARDAARTVARILLEIE